MQFTNAQHAPMSNDALMRAAPAIFAQAPHTKLSESYSFLPTIAVVDAMRGAGWMPVKAMQSRTRDVTRFGLQKHVIRFRHPDASALSIGGLFPEIVMVNSHDGTSAYKIMAGLFRLVCGNGLIVQTANFGEVSCKHVGFKPDDVVEGSFKVIKEVPQLAASVEGMRATTLTPAESVSFAEAAAIVRWGDVSKAPVQPSQILRARRVEDTPADLWSTFNRVQENLIRGGARGRNAVGARRTVRGIASVSEDTRINKALWHLAEQMKAMKSTAV